MEQTIYGAVSQRFTLPVVTAQEPKTLEQSIQEARDYARMVTEISGITSPEAAVAWDIVEELLAARAHRKASSAFDEYCERYPDAFEARMYDV